MTTGRIASMTYGQDYSAWIGNELVDENGQNIGEVSQVYVDDRTGQPGWVTVKTGLFGTRCSFVPIEGITWQGGRLVALWDKATVKAAPQVEEDANAYLRPQEAQDLYRHYGGDYNAIKPTTIDRSEADRTSGRNTDDAMTRSEEQLRVAKVKQEAGRVRLRKYVVTEQVTATIPLSREEVRLEREPITKANRDAALSGEPISEAEYEVVLYEERPVVEKKVVPKERVRLVTETVAGQQEVTEELRKERIATEGVDRRPSQSRSR